MNKRMATLGTIYLASCILFPLHAMADTYRASVTSDSIQLSSGSTWPGISGNGRYITFSTAAAELDGSSRNRQLYRHDVISGETRMISRSSINQPGNGETLFASTMNYEGNLIAFMSYATNLGEGTTNDIGQLYVHDVDLGETRIVSSNSRGETGNHRSEMPRLSADGKFLAFYSSASNLVDQDTNGRADIFLKNLESGETRIVSRGPFGESNAGSLDVAISGNGDVVAFISHASNLVADDTNGHPDAFVYYTDTGTVERISVATDGSQADNRSTSVAVSANGRYVAFRSDATNLVDNDEPGTRDVFIRDLKLGTTVRATEHANGDGFKGMVISMDISADGRYVLFESNALDEFQAPSSGAKLFVKDMVIGDIRQVDIGLDGTSYQYSSQSVMSHDGEHIAYVSAVDNLVSDDTNALPDVFVTHTSRDSGDRSTSDSARTVTVTETVYVPVTEVVYETIYEPVYQTVEIEKIVEVEKVVEIAKEVEVCTAGDHEDTGTKSGTGQQNGKHWGLHWYKDDSSHDASHAGTHPVFDDEKQRLVSSGKGKE